MKKDWIYIILLIVLAVVLCMPVKSLFSENDDDEESRITHVTLAEDGEEYAIPAVEGQVIVMFDYDISEEQARSILADNDAQILSSKPEAFYYLVEVAAGTEGEIVEKLRIRDEIRFVYPNMVCELKAVHMHALDRFPQDKNDDHGRNVTIMMKGDETNTEIQQIDVSSTGDNVSHDKNCQALIDVLSELEDGGSAIINLSSGVELKEYTGLYELFDIPLLYNYWIAEKTSYVNAYVAEIQSFINVVAPFDNKDFVITKAAGNEGMKQFEKILEKLRENLSPEELRIFERHFIIVSAKDDFKSPDHDYPNDLSPGIYDQMVTKVDISDMTENDHNFHGTSFAAPRVANYIMRTVNSYNIKVVDVLHKVRIATENAPDHLLTYELLDDAIKNPIAEDEVLAPEPAEPEPEPEPPFTSPDLKTFQLQGHVKQVVESSGDYTETFSFDNQGYIILPRYRYSDEVTYIHQLKRNSSRQIYEWETMIDETAYHTVEYYKYNSEGFISSMSQKCETEDTRSNAKWTYVLNEQGWPSSAKIYYKEDEYGYGPIVKKTYTRSFTYSDLDAPGNWRKCVIKTAGCKSEYEPFSEKEIITRKITYWQ
jgi:hypothetical protein